MSDLINDLNKIFIDRQERYVYYLIALSVASIGYSVHATIGKYLLLTQIPLAVAVLCWAGSILCGLRFLKYSISQVNKDADYLHIKAGTHPLVGIDPTAMARASKIAEGAKVRDTKIASRYLVGLEVGFYFGIVCFLIWHVVEMYCTTLVVSG